MERHDCSLVQLLGEASLEKEPEEVLSASQARGSSAVMHLPWIKLSAQHWCSDELLRQQAWIPSLVVSRCPLTAQHHSRWTMCLLPRVQFVP